MLPEGFSYIKDVIPSVREDIRYAGSHNFVGCPVDGYFAPRGVLIYDAYRPQRAVDHFVRWAKDESDTKMKEEFYPSLDKSELFPKGYIAVYSGHSRGLTVDLTLTDGDGNELDMGGEFDWFSRISSHDYEGLTPQQKKNRQLLREGMLDAGFDDYVEEWWHYTFKTEGEKVYYDFPIE